MKRLRFRAWRRGFREADLILGGFFDAEGSTLSEDELAMFEQLLEQPDHDIFAWIQKRIPTPTAFETPLMRRLRAFSPAKAGATRAGG